MDENALPISFDEFKRILARELQVDPSKITPQARFIQDLQADSIKLVELMLRLEELGVAIPLEAAWDVETVGDAYQLHLLQQGGARTGAARSPGCHAREQC